MRSASTQYVHLRIPLNQIKVRIFSHFQIFFSIKPKIKSKWLHSHPSFKLFKLLITNNLWHHYMYIVFVTLFLLQRFVTILLSFKLFLFYIYKQSFVYLSLYVSFKWLVSLYRLFKLFFYNVHYYFIVFLNLFLLRRSLLSF